MKRIVTSDWQLAWNERDRYRTDFVVKTLPGLIDKYKPDQLLVLGDLTESKDAHPAPLVNEMVKAFHDLSLRCKVIILQGNHDFLHNQHPFFEFLVNFNQIEWISKPTVLDNCLYLPHTRDYKKDWKHLDFTNGGLNYDFIFAHNIFSGVKANGQELSGIPRNIFPKDCFVISGDVHEPQTLDPVTYVGSPTLCDFGDSYIPRILLLEGLNVKSIKVYGVQKRVIEFVHDANDDIVTDHVNQGDIVKIKVYLKTEHVAEWATIRQEMEDWAAKEKWIVASIVPIVEYEQGERQKVLRTSKKSDNQYLTSLVNRQGVDEKTADVGRQIIETV